MARWLSLSLCLAFLVVACRGKAPGETIRLGKTRDLLLAFEKARIKIPGRDASEKAGRYIHIQQVTARSDARTAIFVHPPAGVTFQVSIDPGARFLADVGMDDHAVGSDGVVFEVACEAAGKAPLLTRRKGTPGLPWRPLRLDLSGFAGRTVAITLRTLPGGTPTNDWAGFANPRVVSDGHPGPIPSFERKPIFLVSLDTLRVRELGAYGSPLPTSPHLDRWLRRSRHFYQAVSPSHWTLPAHMSLMTSLHADVHGVKAKHALRAGVPMLAPLLKAAFYRTIGLVSDVEWLDAKYGFDRGFDRYQATYEPSRHRIGRLMELIEARAGGRLFAFLHLYDAHSDFRHDPYEASATSLALLAPDAGKAPRCDEPRCASAKLREMVLSGRRYAPEAEAAMLEEYRAGLLDLDTELARFFSGLARLHLKDRSAVVLVSDHGEEFADHGGYLHEQIYSETTRCLLAFHLPSRVEAGLVRGMASLVDVAPTILRIADGGRAPESWQGIDLWKEIPTASYTSWESGGIALRTPSSTLLARDGFPMEQFDRRLDPGELHPFVPVDESLGERFSRERAIHARRRLGQTGEVAISPEDAAALKALGYVP